MKKAVIFDLDGTLWDSSAEVCRIWNQVFARRPETAIRITRADMDRIMGKTMTEIGAMLFPGLSPEQQSRIMDECGREEVVYLREHGAVLYEGLRHTLQKLEKDYDLYIVSNCQCGYLEAFLTAHAFAEDFADIEMSGRTGLPKGGNIRLIMERNGVDAAVYVGDTEGDEAAARAAGIPFLHAAYGFGKTTHPDGVIRSITELPEALRTIGL